MFANIVAMGSCRDGVSSDAGEGHAACQCDSWIHGRSEPGDFTLSGCFSWVTITHDAAVKEVWP